MFLHDVLGLVAIESSYFSVCQHVRVQISNSSASVVALTAFAILAMFETSSLLV